MALEHASPQIKGLGGAQIPRRGSRSQQRGPAEHITQTERGPNPKSERTGIQPQLQGLEELGGEGLAGPKQPPEMPQPPIGGPMAATTHPPNCPRQKRSGFSSSFPLDFNDLLLICKD